ncbi:MAG: methyltransferase domain-containing protein [Candidatus Pacebacteria bacterium]|nr:methyltransferase domain-containing protein [Candidatus Paceibacterota bacterium]MDD5356700.1 methyltransferase domain-containing protein [Candidatus Paceibacterota bacterium]
MAFTDPEHNIQQFGLQSGAKVADFGAGSGFYAFEIAKAVGGAGKVYAIDVQKDLLAKIKNEGSKRGFTNIEIIWADVEKPAGTHLKADSVDAVLISNILFQLPDKVGAVAEAKRIVKSGGRILVIDWTDSYGGMGPAFDAIFTAKKAQELFTKAGLTLQTQIRAGDHHYGLIFKK